MSNYKKLDDFDIHWVYELTFVQIRNNLIFIKNKHEHEPYVLIAHLYPLNRKRIYRLFIQYVHILFPPSTR